MLGCNGAIMHRPQKSIAVGNHTAAPFYFPLFSLPTYFRISQYPQSALPCPPPSLHICASLVSRRSRSDTCSDGRGGGSGGGARLCKVHQSVAMRENHSWGTWERPTRRALGQPPNCAHAAQPNT